jgi:putative transposase
VGQQRLRGWLSISGLHALCTRANTRPPRTTQADPQAVSTANQQVSYLTGSYRPQSSLGRRHHLPGPGHWACLVCWRDTFSRRVVGWHVSESLHIDLILTAFTRAGAVCQPSPTVVVSTPAKPLPNCWTVPEPLPV